MRTHRRSFTARAALPILALVIVGALLGSSDRVIAQPPQPRLIADGSVGPDLRALADQTWLTFLAAFPARTGCFGDVHLHAQTGLASRAAYDPRTATVTINVPGTVAMLQSGLVHEWAHHIEFQCPAQQEMRAAFMRAQGLAPETPWRPVQGPAEDSESAWADIPSEQYAEAAVELVLGRRQIPTSAPVRAAGVQVLAQWAKGGG
jgi:hypothetical protein